MTKPGDNTSELEGTILIVEDDTEFAGDIAAKFFEPHWQVEFAYNVPQALAALDRIQLLRAALVDLDLPGGSPFDPNQPGGYGFEVVTRARQVFPATPVIVLTAHLDPRLVNNAQLLGASYLVKANCANNLSALVDRLLVAEFTADETMQRFVENFAAQHSLSVRQAQVVTLTLQGMTHAEIAETLNVTPNTVKRHVDQVLLKSRKRNLAAIVRTFRVAKRGK